MPILRKIPRLWPTAALCLLAVVALGRVALTYSVFNHTADEPTHILCGLEWLQRGTYTIEDLHPPLARVAAAFGPYMDGLRLRSTDLDDTVADELLYRDGKYYRYLTLARLGILPFFLLLICVIGAWAHRLFADDGRAAHGSAASFALVAVLLLTTVPPVLAHAGLATTDLAAAACVSLALFCYWIFLRAPSLSHALIFGGAFGLALLSKMSAWGFVPAGCLALTCGEWLVRRSRARLRAGELQQPRPSWKPAPVALAALVLIVAAGVVWTGYRWSLRPIAETEVPPNVVLGQGDDEPAVVSAMNTSWGRARIPGVEIVHGFREARERIYDPDTHSYFLGQLGNEGFRLFFPVAIAVKTPLPFLVLLIAGLFLAIFDRSAAGRRMLALAAAAILILAICMSARLNIGLRHVLPIYPLFAIIAAYGGLRLWNIGLPQTFEIRNPQSAIRNRELGRMRPFVRVAVIMLLAGQAWTSVSAHPNYLAYFNVLAGGDPSHVLVDSDLDWGQDLDRLGTELRARHVTHLALAYFGSALPIYHDLPPFEELGGDDRPGGWVAISETMLHFNPGSFGWLQKTTPVARVGGSILLYHLPELKQAEEEDPPEAAPSPPARKPKVRHAVGK